MTFLPGFTPLAERYCKFCPNAEGSSLTLVPELDLGVFVSALTDPVQEDSVWTVATADILSKAVLAILDRHRPHPPIPNVDWYVGQYYNNWTVWMAADNITLQASFGGGTMNLTALEVVGVGAVPGVFKAHPTDPEDLALGCRWLDDGTDQELAYFVRCSSLSCSQPPLATDQGLACFVRCSSLSLAANPP
jgi:hypothetical protein